MAGETFGTFLTSDVLTEALPGAVQATDRLAVVRAATAYYAEYADLLAVTPFYTPATVDGFIASDGGITSGDTTFVSASAGFVAGDVGKLISIREAGANWFLNSATVSNGGAGFAVGDLVDFANGAQVYVVEVSAGVVVEFYIVNRGSQSDPPPATISQSGASVRAGSLVPPAVPVAGGTGLVLATAAPTWIRENLVTTIASVTNATTVELALAASATVVGATWGYGTDYGPAIQAALDAGTLVYLPPGIVGHAQTLTMLTGNVLIGTDVENTQLMWLGAAGQPQIFLGTQAAGRADNMRVGYFTLDGLGAASKGYYARAAAASRWHPVDMKGHTTVGMDIHGNDAGLDSIFNVFESFRASYETEDLNTYGIWWGFPNTYDIESDHDLSVYQHIQIKTLATATGFIGGCSDHNTVIYMQVRSGTSSHNPISIDLLGGDWATSGHCRNHQWVGMDAGQGGLKIRATGWANPAEAIFIDYYDRGNGGADYSVEDGALATIRSGTLGVDGFVLRARAFANLPTVPVGGVSYITNSSTSAPGAIVGGAGAFAVFAGYDGTSWRVLAPVARPASLNLAHQSPAGTTNTAAFEMMGMGATATITPTATGRLWVTIWGTMENTDATSGSRVRPKYGTGAAPVNGAAETGTSLCTNSPDVKFDGDTVAQAAPFSVSGVIDVTVGVAVWVDIAMQALVGGTASASGVSVQIVEI